MGLSLNIPFLNLNLIVGGGVPVITVIVAAILAAVIIQAFKFVYRTSLKLAFSSSHGIKPPRHCFTKKTINRDRPPAYFELAFPVWTSAKKDGTRDLRTNDWSIIRNQSDMQVDGWSLLFDNPFEAYEVACQLRLNGFEVPVSTMEDDYFRSMREREKMMRGDKCSSELYERFKDHPTDFEEWFAALVNDLGGSATTTPPSRDGGFDVLGTLPDGSSFVAECKCYAKGSLVGRPIVQKLIGANVLQQAESTLVVTTGGFSDDAAEFAEEVGCYLLAGDELDELISMRDASPRTLASRVMPPEQILSALPTDMTRLYSKDCAECRLRLTDLGLLKNKPNAA